jgi:hypothetical protein
VKDEIIKVNAKLLCFILIISSILYVGLISFTLKKINSAEWMNTPFFSRLLSKDSIGLSACAISIPIIFLLLIYILSVIVVSRFGKNGIALLQDELIIQYRFVRIIFKWENIEYIDYLIEDVGKIYNRIQKRSLIKIHYLKNDQFRYFKVGLFFRKIMGLYESPFTIYEGWMFVIPDNAIYSKLCQHLEYWKSTHLHRLSDSE